MISAQTLRVCRKEKPVSTFPDNALASFYCSGKRSPLHAFEQRGEHGGAQMRTSIFALVVTLGTAVAIPAMAQQQRQPAPNNPQMQDEADKGLKTRNSGESGYVADQDKPGASANAPGRPNSQTTGSSAGTEGTRDSGSGGRSR
jgi:hypothetical protein